MIVIDYVKLKVIYSYVRIPGVITFKMISDWRNLTQHTLVEIDHHD